MKEILKTFGLIFFSLILSTSFGQNRGQGQGMRNVDPETAAENSVKQMKEIITLNNDKEEKAVKEIFLKYAKERQKMMQAMQGGGDRGLAREEMQKMITKQNAELEKILGKERIDKYKKKMEELRRQRQIQR